MTEFRARESKGKRSIRNVCGASESKQRPAARRFFRLSRNRPPNCRRIDRDRPETTRMEITGTLHTDVRVFATKPESEISVTL